MDLCSYECSTVTKELLKGLTQGVQQTLAQLRELFPIAGPYYYQSDFLYRFLESQYPPSSLTPPLSTTPFLGCHPSTLVRPISPYLLEPSLLAHCLVDKVPFPDPQPMTLVELTVLMTLIDQPSQQIQAAYEVANTEAEKYKMEYCQATTNFWWGSTTSSYDNNHTASVRPLPKLFLPRSRSLSSSVREAVLWTSAALARQQAFYLVVPSSNPSPQSLFVPSVDFCS
jgi:hypothetical protein